MRESSLGKAYRFEVYAAGLVLRSLELILQVLNHVVAAHGELDVFVKVCCYQVVSYVESNLCTFGRRGDSVAHDTCFLHLVLCTIIAVNIQLSWEWEPFT